MGSCSRVRVSLEISHSADVVEAAFNHMLQLATAITTDINHNFLIPKETQ
jgi:hypothetical protein